MADPLLEVQNETIVERGNEHRLQSKYEKLKTSTSDPVSTNSETSNAQSTTLSPDNQTTEPVSSTSTSTSTSTTTESTEVKQEAVPTEQPVNKRLGLHGVPSGKNSPGRVPKVGVKAKASSKVEDVKNPDTLIVEDVRVSQQLARIAMQRTKRKVDVASNGEEAVEKYKKHHKSLTLVLMDIMLPGISGIEATKQIRQFESKNNSSGKKIPILGLTGCVSEKDLAKYKEADMDGCIAKGELLATAVDEALKALKAKPTEFVVLTDFNRS